MQDLTHDVAARYGDPASPCHVLVVGEVNPLSTGAEFALYPAPTGCAGWRFANHIVADAGLHLQTWRTNLCVGKWSMPAARARAQRLLDPWAPWSVVVMLGKRVALAFGYRGEAYTRELRQVLCDVMGDDPRYKTLLYLPHPSGLNREWQKPGAYARARLALREAAPSWYGSPAAAV